LRAGFTDIDQARHELGLSPQKGSAETAQAQSPLRDEIQQLRSEIADLRQQLQEQPTHSQNNGQMMNEAAGSANDPRQNFSPYNSITPYYRYPKHWY
jgi:hypothetical protein